MRRSILTLVLVVAAGSLVSAQAPAPVSDDLKRMAGQFKPQSVQFDGKEQLQDPKTKAQLTLVIEGSEYRAYFAPDPAKNSHFRLFTADLALDPATKTFTLSIKDGAKKGEKRHGIYEASGGKLTICYGPAEKPRPTTFAAPAGSDYFLEVWDSAKR